MSLRLVTNLSELAESFDRGRFVLDAGGREGAEGSVECGLGLLDRDVCVTSCSVSACPSLDAPERRAHLRDHQPFNKLGAHGCALLTVPGGRAAVQVVAAVVGGPGDHPGTAGAA